MLTIIKHIGSWSTDFLNLFFPENCAACGQVLQTNEKEICLFCHSDLPFTKFWQYRSNPMEQLFWGRVKVERGVALFYYKKGNRVQQLIHNIKYRRNLSAGEYCGKWLGEYVKTMRSMPKVDVIIPVPLHPKRYKRRGYNQCDCIAKGLNTVLDAEIADKAVKRVIYNISQTKKGRFERWGNVEKIFTVEQPEKLKFKHVLVVDDVITTGSTLEACLQTLNQIEGIKVSVAVLGYSSH